MPHEAKPVNCLCGLINPLTEQEYSFCPFHFAKVTSKSDSALPSCGDSLCHNPTHQAAEPRPSEPPVGAILCVTCGRSGFEHLCPHDGKIPWHYTPAAPVPVVARASVEELLGLRKRIHFLEHHNQHFERCESAWCHPTDNDNPAIGIMLGMNVGQQGEVAPALRSEEPHEFADRRESAEQEQNKAAQGYEAPSPVPVPARARWVPVEERLPKIPKFMDFGPRSVFVRVKEDAAKKAREERRLVSDVRGPYEVMHPSGVHTWAGEVVTHWLETDDPLAVPALRSDTNELNYLRVKVADADKVMAAIDRAVKGDLLSSRSEIADARQQYSEPFTAALRSEEPSREPLLSPEEFVRKHAGYQDGQRWITRGMYELMRMYAEAALASRPASAEVKEE